MNKKCKKCGQRKDVEEFYPHPKGRLGVYSWCKECWKDRARSKPNPETKKSRDARYYDKHKEEVKARAKAYYEKNKEKILLKQKIARSKKISLGCFC